MLVFAASRTHGSEQRRIQGSDEWLLTTETFRFWLALEPVPITITFTPRSPENWCPPSMMKEESVDPFTPDTATELFDTLDSRTDWLTLIEFP